MTLYEKTMEFIRQLMSDPNMVPGDRLPSEVEIAAHVGGVADDGASSHGRTCRRGALERIQGRGGFVRSNRIPTESTIIGGLKRRSHSRGST